MIRYVSIKPDPLTRYNSVPYNNHNSQEKESKTMARRDMVTRTVVGTKAVCKVVDPQSEEITVKAVMLTGSFTAIEGEEAKPLVKAIKKALADQYVFIKVESVEDCSKLYGLDTPKFMEMAVELDPVTRKPIGEVSEDEE